MPYICLSDRLVLTAIRQISKSGGKKEIPIQHYEDTITAKEK